MGVHDVGAEIAEEARQFEQRAEVTVWGHGARRVNERKVAHAACLDRGHVPSGRGGAEHLVTRRDERAELRSEEEFETHVRGGDMNQASCHPVALRYRQRLAMTRRESSKPMPPRSLASKNRMPSLV